MIKGKMIRITKGKDPYLHVTPLADYCLQKGWKVIRECVDIAIPTGDEMKQFLDDMKEGKIVVMNSHSQGKENENE
jgi:hypothetical protein